MRRIQLQLLPGKIALEFSSFMHVHVPGLTEKEKENKEKEREPEER